jgi:hypothetical protein
MQPVIAELQPVEGGRYAGRIEVSMAGDWYLLVTGRTGDGAVFEHTESLDGLR